MQCGYDLHPSCEAVHPAYYLIKSTSHVTPRPSSVVLPNIDLNITWLLQHLDSKNQPLFRIDRTLDSTRTPRRNDEVEAALTFMAQLFAWAQKVAAYFTQQLFPVQSDHGLDLTALNDSSLFVPILPVFETPDETAAKKDKKKDDKERKDDKDKKEEKKDDKGKKRDKKALVIPDQELGSSVCLMLAPHDLIVCARHRCDPPQRPPDLLGRGEAQH